MYNYVAIASDHLSLLRTVYPKGVRTDIVQSHLRPITTVRYSHCFNQIVTSCEGAVSLVLIRIPLLLEYIHFRDGGGGERE